MATIESNIEVLATKELEPLELRSLLERIVQLGVDSSEENVRLLFGFAWGNFYGDWNEIVCNWSEVIAHVDVVEAEEHGSLGTDDLYIYIGEDEFQFCHHGDIHYPAESKTDLGGKVRALLSSLPPNK